ncbi:lysylphosphatidylglycerol synthase transmembrane domain-containing protein [Corynebacterium stationis]|uniref:lysylphosphatidylglycerol synthase transmembrane domain-containing protein n=1 Tax=Corynebacterium stationis TaxID=1705 RepID=UPI0009FAC311|nr:YbhN family protein [Corynebacterium stationis]
MTMQSGMRWLRWGASLLVLIVLIWVFRDELDFLEEGFRRLSHANAFAVVIVIIASLASLVAMSGVMQQLMVAGGVNVSVKEATAISLASNAWSTTLPAGPAFSALLTFHVQRAWGATIALCAWFFVVSSAVSTIWLVLIGLSGVMLLRASIGLGALIISLALMVLLLAGLFWVTNNPRTVERWLKRQKIIKGKVRDGLVEQARNLKEVHLSRYQFLSVSALSFGHRLFDMVALWACVWAVSGAIPWINAGENETTLAGVTLAYITAKLAGSAQITPAGLGTVEAAIIATLVATGMTAVEATGTAVIYRLISFALMTAIGWVVYFWHYARKGLKMSSLSTTSGEKETS